MTRAEGVAARTAGWLTAPVALARIAWLRTVLYLFVILDMHAFVRDTRPALAVTRTASGAGLRAT